MIAIAESFGIEARVIGRAEHAERSRLTIRGDFGELAYEY
jgi:hypothetical protein